MADTFLSPGVKTREVTGGAQPISGVFSSTAAFYGVTERGPVGVATLITSLAEFQRVFGDALSSSFMFYGIRGFFANGGSRCFVTRVTHYAAGVTTSSASTLDLLDGAAAQTMAVNAISDGEWGQRIEVAVSDSSDGVVSHFKLTVSFDGIVKEIFDNLSKDATLEPDNYIENVINGQSDFIVIDDNTANANTPANVAATALALGDDGLTGLNTVDFSGDAVAKNGILSFDEVEENLNIAHLQHPSFNDNDNAVIAGNAVAYAANREDSVVVTSVPSGLDPTAAKDYALGTGSPALPSEAVGNQFGNLYYPFVLVQDPIGVGSNPVKFVPPSGHVAGVYARTDRLRGVHKAPAGIEANLLDTLGVERKITKADHDTLNPVGVNAIRVFTGRGILVFGARNLDSRVKFRYTNVRRYLNFYKKSLEDGLFPVVFEPNDSNLWGQLRRQITAFNLEEFRKGALTGQSAEEAFFVKIDRDINTDLTIARGELHVQIGIAISRPAEFIILDITQFAGSVQVEEA